MTINNECRGGVSPSPECAEWSRNFPPLSGCENLGEANCVYGSAGTVIPATAPCELTPHSTGQYATRCSGLGQAPTRLVNADYQPYFCVHFVNGARDADGNNTAFYGREAMVSYLQLSPLTLAIDPCAPERYGCRPWSAPWLTRMFLDDRYGWQMLCNYVEKCKNDPWDPDCEQHVLEPVTVNANPNGVIALLTLANNDKPYCFGWARQTFCLIADCKLDSSGEKLIECIGDSSPGHARAVDRLYIDLTCSYGTDSQFVDSLTRELHNAMWATLDAHLDQLDAPGHSAYHSHDAAAVRLWYHSETFADPAVQGFIDPEDETRSYYSEYDEVDIPITLIGQSSGAVYSELAKLTLQKINVTVNLIAEADELSDYHAMRITGSVIINLSVRVKRDVEDTGKYDWLNASDLFDLRVEDPDNLGYQHPRETILAIGPNGERVWRQADDAPTDGALHTWEGLKGPQTHSRGPNTFDDTYSSGSCCDFLLALTNLAILAKTDDNTGLDDRFKRTRCRLMFDGDIMLNGQTLELWLETTFESQKIAEFTDTTQHPEDAMTALVDAWNASSQTLAQEITASRVNPGTFPFEISLTADNSSVPNHSVRLEITAGDVSWNPPIIDAFDELPQYYEGGIVLRPGLDVGC